MFSLKTLTLKRYQMSSKGNMVVDLTRSSLDYNTPVYTEAIVRVPEDFVMRPDLIALSAYGDDSKFDYILKHNGVSNPFSIYEDQVLEIPSAESFERALRLPPQIVDPENPEAKQFIKSKSKLKSDHEKALEEKNNTTILPPNMNDDGEDNIVIDNGKISLGNNSNDSCDVNKSRARAKARLLRNMM